MEPRPYIRRNVEPSIVETPAGTLLIEALEKDRVRVDSAWVHGDETTSGLTLNGVTYGATGFVWLSNGEWTDRPPDGHVGDLMLSRRGSFGNDATPSAQRKARAIVSEAVKVWAEGNGEALAEADRIWRNNEARGAEEAICKAEEYLAELREIVASNDGGETRSQYSTSFEPLVKRR